MGETTKIEWADHTWNPWVGCSKVSPGCKFCYMFRDGNRYGWDPNVLRRTKRPTFNKPLSWNRKAENKGSRVFTCSWTDWFHKDADAWRADAWDIIRRCQNLTFMILTKRPERIAECLPDDWGAGWPNVWLGVSAENEEQYRRRWRQLYQHPAAVYFVSMEPLLGPIEMEDPHDERSAIPDWVIIGGESGGPKTSRPMRISWAEDIVSQCKAAGVPVFFKQTGAWGEGPGKKGESLFVAPDGTTGEVGIDAPAGTVLMHYIGGKDAHELPSGKYLEFPA